MASFTRKAIMDSFMKLVDQRPISKITIKDIVEDCGVNRNTFYYHFADIPALIDFFEAVPEYDTAMYCHKKMKTNEETSLEVLKEILPRLEAWDDYSNDALFGLLKGFAEEKGYKNGYVMWPLRTAVSGKQMTPAGATEIMEIIGKEETLKRVKAAIEKLS